MTPIDIAAVPDSFAWSPFVEQEGPDGSGQSGAVGAPFDQVAFAWLRCDRPLPPVPPQMPPPNRPLVSVVTVDGKEYIQVNPEPLHFKAGTPSVIRWELPVNSPYTFPNNGIEVTGLQREKGGAIEEVASQRFPCRPGGGTTEHAEENQPQAAPGKVFVCTNPGTPGIFHYTIRVNHGDTPVEPTDPTVVNHL